jgi:hypothetical protein
MCRVHHNSAIFSRLPLVASFVLQLWATVGFAFNVSVACTSVSSRIKKSYDILLEPLDQVRPPRQRLSPNQL